LIRPFTAPQKKQFIANVCETEVETQIIGPSVPDLASDSSFHAALADLVDLPAELGTFGWQMAGRAGRDLRRCRSFLEEDLDMLGEVASGYEGPVKIQVVGPWTLAAQLWVPSGERATADPGAYRDVIDSLTEGTADHVRTVRRRVPGAVAILQVDEPSLSAVVSGTLRSASGIRGLPAVDAAVVTDGLRQVVDGARGAGASSVALHSCSPEVPIPVMSGAGPDAVNLETGTLVTGQWEALAALVESGTVLWPGLVPATGDLPPATTLVDALWRPWRDLGLDRARLRAATVTPACGLAGLDEAAATATLARTRQVTTELAERLRD
jgi:methionine synthase II (cobalamin-independent)